MRGSFGSTSCEARLDPAIAVADRGESSKGRRRASRRPVTPDPIGSGSIDQIRVKWPLDLGDATACLAVATTSIGWRRRVPRNHGVASRRPGCRAADQIDRNQLDSPLIRSRTRTIAGRAGVRWRSEPRPCRRSFEFCLVMTETPPGRTERRPCPAEPLIHPSHFPIRGEEPTVSPPSDFLGGTAASASSVDGFFVRRDKD